MTAYQKVLLAPGEVLRRAIPKTTANGRRMGGYASWWNRIFPKTGRADYHAYEKTKDGVRYLFIERDVSPDGDA